MKITTHLFSIATFLTAAIFVPSGFACSLDEWQNATTGASVGDPAANVARVGGKCALKVTGTGHVVDNSPDDETMFTGRFYFYPKMLSAGTYEIFVAYSDQTDINSDVFVITFDGTDIKLDASAAGGGTASATADLTHWNLVEFDWKSGAQGQLWVNADAVSVPATDTFASGVGSVDQVRLGAVDGIGTDVAFFDDYVSQRSAPVGALKAGDGNSDGEINSDDAEVIVDEYLFDKFGTGVVDCNLDGAVNSGDVNCVVADT